MTGYLIDNDPMDDFMDGVDEEESEEAESDVEDLRNSLNMKAKDKKGGAEKRKATAVEDDDEDESDDSDFDASGMNGKFLIGTRSRRKNIFVF